MGQDQELETFSHVVSQLLTVPAIRNVHLEDGSAKTIVRAATLRYKLKIKLVISLRPRKLTAGQPGPVTTLDATQESN